MWFVVGAGLIGLGAYGYVDDGSNPLPAAIAGIIIMAIPNLRTWNWKRIGLIAFVAIASIGVFAAYTSAVNLVNVTTPPDKWEVAKDSLGLPQTTQLPNTKPGIAQLIAPNILESPQKNELVNQMADELRSSNRDLTKFSKLVGQSNDAAKQFNADRMANIIRIKQDTIDFVIALIIVCALIGVFLSYPIEGIGKLSGTAL